MSAENCSSDFDVWIVEFYTFGEFIDRGSGSRDIVDDKNRFVAEESEIWGQRKYIFQIFYSAFPIQARLRFGMFLLFRYFDSRDSCDFT